MTIESEYVEYLETLSKMGGHQGLAAREQIEIIQKRTYTQEQRDEYAKTGVAMPDGSYPIPDIGALHDAISSYGRSPDAATKAHIKRRARALGATAALPKKWQKAQKILDEWGATIHKAGDPAALIDWYNSGADGQIDWGSPGDFDDCVAIAGRYLDNPQGFCNLRHQDATGAPPGHAPGEDDK
jgi:hypothetical protein